MIAGRRTNTRRKQSILARVLGLFTACMLAAMPATSQASVSFTATGGRPFADASAWNAAIGRSPVLDPNSDSIVTALAGGAHPGIANLYEFGTPIYTATAATPRYAITCSEPWGTCPLQAEGPIPIPYGAVANTGSDGKMEVVDYGSGKAYEFWQYHNDHATTSWGGVVHDVYDGDGREGGAIGAGVSQLAGLVRVADINSGVIDHALAFSTRFCMGPTNSGNYRYPATKTDGTYSGNGAVMEGSRLQLDPSINVDAIAGITAGEKMVAKALQEYGAYVVDCGAANMAFGFEKPTPGQPDPYPGVGLSWDYFGMDHIPWNRLRVLQAWDSSTPD